MMNANNYEMNIEIKYCFCEELPRRYNSGNKRNSHRKSILFNFLYYKKCFC